MDRKYHQDLTSGKARNSNKAQELEPTKSISPQYPKIHLKSVNRQPPPPAVNKKHKNGNTNPNNARLPPQRLHARAHAA